MRLIALSADDLRRALPMRETIEAMKGAFADLSSGRAQVPQRLAVNVPSEGLRSDGVPPAGGTVLLKPAYQPGHGVGAKLVSVFPGNTELGKPLIHGIVVLLDPATGEPQALLEGGFLTAWRTGAAAGAATDLLARADARIGAVIGCGVQGRTQAAAIDAARSLSEIRIYARTPDSVTRFVTEMQPDIEARLVAVASPAEAVEGAGVICAATTSSAPVFPGNALAPGCHVNGVGSFTPQMQEVDLETVRRSTIYVDSRDAARAEAGDLLIAEEAGATTSGDWRELGEVVEGTAPGRQSDNEITFFKSVGVAVQDIAAGSLALERAAKLRLGSVVEL